MLTPVSGGLLLLWVIFIFLLVSSIPPPAAFLSITLDGEACRDPGTVPTAFGAYICIIEEC